MIKLFQINSGIIGSTGTIMREIDKYSKLAGFETYMSSVKNRSSQKAYPDNHIAIGTIVEKRLHRFLSKITGNDGCFSHFATKKLIKQIDKINPDIVQLHNLHWSYVNIGMLFKYLKQHKNIKVVWTLHDCWAYTGHCPYYDLAKCDKWKTECSECSLYRNYPVSYIDNSKKMFNKKKQWFTGMDNLTLVTPSKWLYNEVNQSFLKNENRIIINNGIDINKFQRKNSSFKEEYDIKDKFMVLGIAYSWSYRKGFDAFIELSKALDDRFRIVLVGHLSKEQVNECISNDIIYLDNISDKEKLSEIYSCADVFFNPTREEMFGLVNIEAQACGTPVITFKSGGSPECIGEWCGYVVEKEDILSAVKHIEKMFEEGKPDYRIFLDWVNNFGSEKTYAKYIQLYKNLLEK